MFALTDESDPGWFKWGVIYHYMMPASAGMGMPELDERLPYYYGAKHMIEGMVGMQRFLDGDFV